MLTNKEKFLQNLKDKIKMYQDAYEYNKNLPDDIFDSIHNVTVELHYPKKGNEEMPSTNIGILRKIIKDADIVGISKNEMVRLFPKNGKSDKEHYAVVTNTLAQLRQNGEVHGVKPKNTKMKGYYWHMNE